MGEEATEEDVGGDWDVNKNAFLRTVVITMNCSTPNATLRYTTDGFSVPTGASPSVAPGTAVQWSEEGTTEFTVIAVADGLYESELTKWPVTIVAPRIDEYSVAVSGSSSSSSSSSSGGETPRKRAGILGSFLLISVHNSITYNGLNTAVACIVQRSGRWLSSVCNQIKAPL